MKILQLITKRQYRGAEVFAANLSSELIKLGHQIIFAGLYKNESDTLEVPGAINRDLCNRKSAVFSPSLVRAIVELVRKTRPDVIQCNGSDTLKYMVAASLFLPKIPITYRNISTISEWINNPLKLGIYKFLFQKVDHVTSVGSESIQDLVNTLGYPEGKTSIIRRGIPIKELKPEQNERNLKSELNLDEEAKIVMHIGNFSPEKNHEFLLEIFSELKEDYPWVKLVCVGSGETFQEIQSLIRNKDLEDTVFLLGFRKDVPELLAQSDCFVLPSKIEGVPGVVLEAASQRIPSVATQVGGVPEVIVDGETGYIIPDFNKTLFKTRLLELVSNPELNKQMGDKAFLLAQNEFNPIQNAQKFEKLYAELAGISLGKSKEKLRILQIIQKKQYRGAEMFACQLANHLRDSGHLVRVISIYEGEAKLPYKGNIDSLNRKKITRTFDPYGWKKLASIIESFNPDVIQANASDTLKYAVMSKFLFGWRKPLIYRNASTPSFYIKNSLTKKINAFLLANIDLVISVSEASRKDLNFLYPFTSEKSIVIPVGVEETKARNFIKEVSPFEEKEAINLLHVGSFTREKNHRGLLRIFEQLVLENPKFHLNLIGSGPLLKFIENVVSERQLGSKVSFLGEIQDPQHYIAASSMLLLPSLVEGLPGVILESMNIGTPVVAYDVGGVSEVVCPDTTGKLVKFNDEQAFKDAILDLEKNTVIRKQLTQNGKKLIRSSYLNSEIMQRFENSYKHLLT